LQEAVLGVEDELRYVRMVKAEVRKISPWLGSNTKRKKGDFWS
jgi:hypothetical protein